MPSDLDLSAWSWGESNCHAVDFVFAGQRASDQVREDFGVTGSVRHNLRITHIPRRLATFRDLLVPRVAPFAGDEPARRRGFGP